MESQPQNPEIGIILKTFTHLSSAEPSHLKEVPITYGTCFKKL